MGSITVICGKSATGKDTIIRELFKRTNLTRLVPFTTREKRSSETNGVEYFFVKDEDISSLVEKYGLVEMREYPHKDGVCKYFEIDNLDRDKNYITTSSPEGMINIINYYKDKNMKCIGILIYLDTVERLRRAYIRETKETTKKFEELVRRFLADEDDFDKKKAEIEILEHFYKIENIDIDSSVEQVLEIFRKENIQYN